MVPAMGSCDPISLVPLSRLLSTSPLSTNLSPSLPAPARSLLELRQMNARSAAPACPGRGRSAGTLHRAGAPRVSWCYAWEVHEVGQALPSCWAARA